MPDLDAEIARLSRRVRAEPRSTAFVGLADALRRAARHGEALQVLREGFRVHPDHAPGRVGLARVHVAMGNPALAIAVLDEVVRMDAENVAAVSLLCRLLVDDGRLHDARPLAERLKAMAPDDPNLAAYRERASAAPVAFRRTGDPFESPWLAESFCRKGHYARAARIWRALEAADASGPRRSTAIERAMAGLGDVEGEPPLQDAPRRPLPGLADALEALVDEPPYPRARGRGPLRAFARRLEAS